MSAQEDTKTAWEAGLYPQYLGALSLLGRLVGYSTLSSADRSSVDRAFQDANRLLERKKAGVRFERSTPGSYAAFDHEEPR